MRTRMDEIGRRMMAVLLVLGVATSGWAQQAKPAAVAPATATPVVEKAPPMDTPWNTPLPPGRMNFGIHFGDQQVESFGDIVAPIIQFKSGLMFVNPRGTWNDDDGQEFNLGLGYRHLFPERSIIVGGNLFYDLRNTSLDNTFNQFGCGLEFLSTWVDARVNAYLPENGKKTADTYTKATSQTQEQTDYWYAPTGQGNLITQYGYDVRNTYDVTTMQHYQMTEQAMDGFDCELGALLPVPVVREYADVKAFVGYYDFNAHYGDDISGMKGRLEIRPMPALYLDAAWFEDDELFGSRYSVGARASVPFDLASLSRGKNPFSGAMAGFKPGGAKQAFSSRMTEMVMRDLHIRTDASEPKEVVEDRQILEKTLTGTDRTDYNLVLASGVTFVDDDNRSGVEDGSWENPYRQINTGVQRAVGAMVYVRDANQQYYENVVLRDGLTLWGSGAPIYGQGGRYLGGIYPVVNGMGRGPAITLANQVTVAGFEITQPYVSYPAQAKRPSSGAVGIFGENVTDVSIFHNYIHDTETGIRILAFSMPSVSANISNNRIEDIWAGNIRTKYAGGGEGVDVSLYGVTEADLMIANNTITRCGGDGLSIYADGGDGDTFIARISGDYSGNGGNGVYLNVNRYDTAAGLFVDTAANNNGREGISASFYDNYMSGVLLASHADLSRADQLVRTVEGGIDLLPGDLVSGFNVGGLLGVGGLYREGGSMQANGNGGTGIYISQQSRDLNLAGLIGVQADGNGSRNYEKDGGGSGVEIYQSGYYENADVSVAALIRCQANGNGGPGMRVSSYADDLALNVFMDVRANDNYNCGVRSSVYSQHGWAGSVVLSSDPLMSLIETVSSSSLLSDYVSPMDMSFIPAYGQVQANRNGGSGIYIDAQGDDGAFGVVLDAQANGNGLVSYQPGNGIQLDVNSGDGMAIALAGSTESLMRLAGNLLDGGGVPLDLSGVRTLGPVQVNDNRENGVYISANGYDGALVGAAGVEALRNGLMTGYSVKNGIAGDGVYLNAFSENGDAMAGLAWVNASDNGSDGIYANVTASSPDGEAMLGGINLTANDNWNQGVELDIQSAAPSSSYLVLAGIEANGNDRAGIDVRLSGNGVAMAALTGITANDNGGHGISVETDTYSTLDGNSHVWISDTAVQDMGDHGGGFDFLGMDVISMLPSGGIEVSGNGGSGINISADSQGNSLVDVGDLTASGNGGNGIAIETTSYNGHADVHLDHNTASSNGMAGIQVDLSAATDGSVDVMNSVANENGSDGFNIAAATGFYLDLYGRSNVARNNEGNGITLTTEAGSASYDFGTEENRGNNVMTGNDGYGMEWVDNSDSEDALSARNNYWGGEPDYAGNINADPFLTDDPTVP